MPIRSLYRFLGLIFLATTAACAQNPPKPKEIVEAQPPATQVPEPAPPATQPPALPDWQELVLTGPGGYTAQATSQTLHISAPPGFDTDTREVFWRSSSPGTFCATFDATDRVEQPGIAVIYSTGPDSTDLRVVTVTRNTWASYYKGFNVHWWPVAGNPNPGGVELFQLAGYRMDEQLNDDPGPWRLCVSARAQTPQLHFRIAGANGKEGEGFSALPLQVADQSPVGFGLYAGHMRAGEGITYWF